MANAPIQGLRIALKLADASDVKKILANLNLSITDLDRIRNISNDGVEQADIKSLSGLTFDLDKEVVAIYNETGSYSSLLSNLNDGRRRIAGNLDVVGRIVAPTFKFNKAVPERFYTAIPATNITGGGSGALFNISRTISSPGYSVTLNNGGTGYSATAGSNTIRILGNQVGGTTTANDITITITGIGAGGDITTFTIPAVAQPGNITPAYGNGIATLDFSTSRSSAWSAFGDPTVSIFYGGDVIITGATSSIELSSLNFSGTIKPKIFESQLPTHKIRVNIDGLDYDLYAMKGIPIRLKGFFRNVNSTIQIDFDTITNPENNQPYKPSWILRNTKTGTETVIKNRISGSSATNRSSLITYFDSTSVERDIEFFYPVDKITSMILEQVKIYGIPTAKIDAMRTLRVTNGDLLEMPDLRTIYPNLTTLYLNNNDLTRSNTVNLRTFSTQVIDRLPLSLTSLQLLNNPYSGSVPDVGLSAFTNLIEFSVASGTGSIRRMTGISPAIAPSVLSYNITGNRFSALHPSVVGSNTLKSLYIGSNGISGTISSTNLTDLEIFSSNYNTHTVFNAQGKTKLVSYVCTNMRFPTVSNGNIGTNIFVGCVNLKDINVSSTNISGALPNFSSNTSLTSFISNANSTTNTSWLNANADFSIAANTFGSSGSSVRSKLVIFDLRSRNLNRPIDPLAFVDMNVLKTLYITSYATKAGLTGINGSFPTSLNACISLTSLNLNNNKLSGELPPATFANNKLLVSIDISTNKLSGAFPSIDLPKLTTLSLSVNEFTSVGILTCPSLTTFSAIDNKIAEVPNFDSTPNIRKIYLNSNINLNKPLPEEQGIKYANNPFGKALFLDLLEMKNCKLDEGTVNSIILDLYKNYLSRNRSNVIVDLRENTKPGVGSEVTSAIKFLRSKGWTLFLTT